ncbi:MAG: hypothetical protein VB021_01885 [Oscillospiraceae bacterium]|nr:hypothetical protein [Oscillospiraceae bacterium]
MSMSSSPKLTGRGDLSPRWFCALLFALIAGKLFLCSFQMITVFPGSAPIDDEWLLAAAQSIERGEWLGAYTWLTLTKNMFFSVWLALLHTLGIPYLIGNQLLYLAACAVCCRAAGGRLVEARWQRLLFFAVLWLSPYSYATATLRLYRDSITQPLALLFFGGMLGFCLRWRDRLSARIGFAAAAGLGLGLTYITKEDGVWMVPYAAAASLVYILFVLFDKSAPVRRRIAGLAAPAVLAAVCLCVTGAYCYMNYRYYGRFIANEISAPEFVDALEAMRSADDDLPHEANFVCYETRERIYAAVPLAAQLGKYLDGGAYYAGYGDPQTREFNHGGFFFMVQKAAYDAGLATTAQQKQAFFAQLAADINAALDDGRLTRNGESASSPISSGMVTPYDPSYLSPTLAEAGSSFRALLLFEQCSPFAPLSYATPEQAAPWEAYTRTKASNIAVYGTAQPLFSTAQKLTGYALTAVTWVYRAAIFPALLAFAVLFVRRFGKACRELKKPLSSDTMQAVLLLGLLLTVLLRVGMVAYVEAVNFHIGTQLHYLAGAGILLLICAALGAAGIPSLRRR